MFGPKIACSQCYGTGIVSVIPLYFIGRSQPGQPCNNCSAHEKLNDEKTGGGMFNVEKLSKLLREIFTRDNENFSPELIAEELNERIVEVVEKDATADREDFITEKEFLSWRGEVIDKLIKEHREWPYQIDEAFFRKMEGEWVSVFALPAISIKTDDGRYKLATGGVIITKQEFIEAKVDNSTMCVVIGNSSKCAHNNSVVIGNNQKSDKPNQLKIGNNDISVSRDITDEEFKEILATFKSVREFLPK